MANPTWFNEQEYLASKLKQLKANGDTTNTEASVLAAIEAAGYTPYTHFTTFGAAERTSPNKYFNATEYLEAKVKALNAAGEKVWTVEEVASAFVAANVSPWEHFTQWGAAEGLNPSNAFDVSSYYDAKVAQLNASQVGKVWTVAEVKAAFTAAGLNPISHYLQYGSAESLTVTPVPAAEQVATDPRDIGPTFTLTTGADIVGPESTTFKTTDGDDTITGTASSLSSERTLNPNDKIDGGLGKDTLNVDLKGGFDGFTKDQGFLKNVETVNLTNSSTIARTFTATEVTGVETYNLKGAVALADLGAAGVAVNVADLSEGTVGIGFRAAAVTGASDALTLGLNNVGTKGATAAANKAVTVNANGIETLNVNATGVNVATLAGVNAATVTVAGAGSLTVTGTGANLKSVDASAATGAQDLTINAGTSVSSVKTGSADDIVRVDASKLAVNATVDGGAGNDTLSLSGLNATTLQLSQSNIETLQITGATGANVLSGLNTTGLKSLVLNGQGTANTGLAAGSLTLAQFAESDLNLTVSGENAGSVIATNKGAFNLSTVAETATTTTTAITTAVTATEASSATINVGARTDLQGAVIANNATELKINVATAKSAAGAELTKLDGDVTANKAGAVTVEAAGRLATTITATEAQQVAVTTGATATGESDTLALVTGNAKSVNITAGGDLNLTGSTFGKAEQVTIAATKAVTGGVALNAVNVLNVSGVASTAAVTLGALGDTSQDYALTVNATGLKGGFTATTIDTKGQAITLDSQAMTGKFDVGAVNGGSVIVNASNQLGSTKVGAITSTAGSTVTLNANGILGGATGKAFEVASVAVANSTAGALTGSINLNLNGTSGKFDVGTLTAGTVVVEAATTNGGAIGTTADYALGAINANTATVSGNSLTANTFTINADSITYAGGLGIDDLTLGGQTAGTANKVTVSLNVNTGLGDDVVGFSTKAVAALETTLTGTVNLGDGNDALTLTVGAGAGSTLNASGLTVTGAETVTINAAAEGSIIVGTAGKDTIVGGAEVDTITGGLGADTLSGGAKADIFVIGNTDSGITVATADVITDFATASDKLKLGVAGDATVGTGNFVTSVGAAADFAAALAAANTALAALAGTSAATELYAYQFTTVAAVNTGYLFNDVDGNGTADQVIILTGSAAAGVVAADIIA